MSISVRVEEQLRPVADEVSALTAVVRPILEGILYSLKRDIAQNLGGYDRVTLEMLARVYRPGDGDCGLCFEYAVHDALNRGEGTVLDRVETALKVGCGVPGVKPASVLFGLEKNGAVNIIDSAKAQLTEASALLYGTRGRPAKLLPYVEYLAKVFRRPDVRASLPTSLSGLWKADLFLGHADADYWVGTTVKINPTHLVGAKGLRVGIVPSRQGRSDRVYKDDARNLVICPIPHDQAFMEIFYQGWGVVQQFIAADAKIPKEVNLPRPADRQVARYLEERRIYPVVDVLAALGPLSQPELLKTNQKPVQATQQTEVEVRTESFLAPVPIKN